MFRRRNQQSRDESSGNNISSNIVRRNERKSIKIDGRDSAWSVAFLADGRHIVGGGAEQKVRRWRVLDGTEETMSIMPHAEGAILNIAVSQDGRWVVCGTSHGVVVWNAQTRERVTEIPGQGESVNIVDISLDGPRIVTGSEDGTVQVYSLDTGQQLLDPLQHDYPVVGVKFSPDGRLIATATQWGPTDSVCIYDSRNGNLVVDFPVRVGSLRNQSLAWASDSKELFALSFDGNINCLDTSSRMILSTWAIHSTRNPSCIVLASNGSFIAASGDYSVSFWDTMTHNKIGSLIHVEIIESMAISANHDIVIGGGQTITLWSLRDILSSPYCSDISPQQETKVEKADHEVARESPLIQDEDPRRIADLKKTVQELRSQLADSARATDREKERLNNKIAHLENTVQQLRGQLTDSQHMAGSLAQVLRFHELKHNCEALYAVGRIFDAASSLPEMVNAMSEVRTNKFFMDWLAEFTSRCTSTLEMIGDKASNVKKYDEALTAYSTALSLSPSTTSTVLTKWAKTILIHDAVDVALHASTKFQIPRFAVYQTICDVLEGDNRFTEAVECFRRMQSELAVDTTHPSERAQWELGFKRRLTERLDKLGDAAIDSGNYSEAVEHFSTILLFDPVDRLDPLIKRSNARALISSWADALSDADEAIKLDASCYRGYKMRHTALHGARRYAEAVDAFRTMLSKLEGSPEERIRGLSRRYVDASPTIRRIVEHTTRNMPRMLIDTTTGRLYDKKLQAEAFEALPIYFELVSSMTMELDHARIWRAVKKFYRYVMLSHRWECDEPLLQKVEGSSVYKLEASSANLKLQTFCSLARSLGFRWAWSDTCCVDKDNNVVLQESLVAMFTWYRGSSLTIVYLRGVFSQSQVPGALRKSIWNTRAWTYQEYIAAETVQFYTEDWKPYLGLKTFNHKESPVIISEMQQMTGQDATVLGPGLNRVREKLYLASMRQTTLVEDIAYSLLGIFNAAIPVIYGEGNRAVGRFLEHILTGSGDVTILAWTGRAGSYNSCLPPDLTVYDQLIPQHVPQPIEKAQMDIIIMVLRSSLPDLSVAVTLHNRLDRLPSPSFTASRLTLPGITFSITELDHTSGSGSGTSLHVYHATTSGLGEVEIMTTDNLSGMKDLLFIHPWISPLLDQEFSHGVSALDDTSRALRLVARLRQPFGALLLQPLSRARYKRVAADCLIMVHVREETPLSELIDCIRTVDIQ